jgi:L-fuconolactonase
MTGDLPSERRTVLCVIDAHHHLWDPAVRKLPWLEGDQPWATAEELAPLRRAFTVEDLAPLARATGVTGTVVIQTLADTAETRDMLAIADGPGPVQGVVGWVDLTAPDVADQVAALRAERGGRRLSGIRHPMLAEPDPGWLARPAVRDGLRALGAAGLCFDLTVFTTQLPEAVATSRSVPECVFVLDHLGNPPVETGDDGGNWARAIAELGALENVVCKLSGAHSDPPSPGRLRPYYETVLAAFGPDRLMFGSDWPVSSLTAPYGDMVRSYLALLDGLSTAERDAILDGTARRIYQPRPA